MPVYLSVGRLAVEKNLKAFLDLDLPGTKLVVGDGPARAALQRKYPDAVFLGARHGEELAEIYAASDIFVFPSKTDTFGLVLLEALASGLPVAAFPVTGPRDVIGTTPVGVLDDDLRVACLAALQVSRNDCVEFAAGYSWQASARVFVDHALNTRPVPSEGEVANLERKTRISPPRAFRLTRFLDANRWPPRIKSGAGFRSKTLWSSPECVLPAPRVRRYKWGMIEQASNTSVAASDIDAAARVVAPFAVRTPLLSFPVLNERIGTKVFLKPEMLQRTGSFKFRGAFNKLASIPQDKRSGGVVAFSSGNHAQGVAAAAQILSMRATIVMPADSPVTKRERTKGYGAEVVLYDRDKEDREAIANSLAAKHGATLVRPYDDPFVIAGQGTAGREIAEDMAALGLVPDIVVAPASGGGLIAGVATAVKAKFPQAQIIVAEPKDYDDHGLSLRAGHREAHHAAGRTICDALMAAMPGELTFAINNKLLASGVIASDEEVGAAVAYAYRELKLVVEPGGAVGLAALLAGRIDTGGKNVVIVLSGGNVDADLFAKLVA